jgi:hypothetical protein
VGVPPAFGIRRTPLPASSLNTRSWVVKNTSPSSRASASIPTSALSNRVVAAPPASDALITDPFTGSGPFLPPKLVQ